MFIGILVFPTISNAAKGGGGGNGGGTVSSPPVANAGADFTVKEGDVITLEGSCNDSDAGDNLTGSWSLIEGSCKGNLQDTQSGKKNDRPRVITGECETGDVETNTTFTFKLTCDDKTTSAEEMVKVTINAAPVVLDDAYSVDTGSSVNIELKGFDPDGEDIYLDVRTLPKKGGIVWAPPFIVYTPNSDASGQDSFEFVVSDGVQESNVGVITLNITSNAAPVCSYVEEPQNFSISAVKKMKYEKKNAQMPQFECSDGDGDIITSKWVQLGEKKPGEELHFNDKGELDTMNFDYKRGTYYAQMLVEDEHGNRTVAGTVSIEVPNNAPELVEEEASIEGMQEDGVLNYVSDEFENVINMKFPFSDFDDDGILYTWRLKKGVDGFVRATADGRASMRIRSAGTFVIEIVASDGYGGEVSEEITFYQPPPEIPKEKQQFRKLVTTLNGKQSKVEGIVSLPVQPVVRVNDVDAEVSLSFLSVPASLSKSKPVEDLDESIGAILYDAYIFKADGVSLSEDAPALKIDVVVNVDGEEVMLFSKSFNVDKGDDATDTTDDTGGDDSGESSFAVDSGQGCSLQSSPFCFGKVLPSILLQFAVLIFAAIPRIFRTVGGR